MYISCLTMDTYALSLNEKSNFVIKNKQEENPMSFYEQHSGCLSDRLVILMDHFLTINLVKKKQPESGLIVQVIELRRLYDL